MENQSLINEESIQSESKKGFTYFPFFNNKQPVFILVLLGLIFYSVSLNNEYALDDGIIIHQNEYVLKGVRGIKDLVSKDMYQSFYKRMNASDQLEGGRYRPLTTISFAIEQEFIGTYRSGYYNMADDLNKNGKLDDDAVMFNTQKGTETNYEYNKYKDLNGDKIAQPGECYPCWDINNNFHNDTEEDINRDGVFNEVDCQVYGAWIRHFVNLVLYLLCAVLVYVLLKRYMLPGYPDVAFLAALLFLVHPVHSEVVANVKGRDELLSFIFICLTFIYSFKFIHNKRWLTMLCASAFFFLALMSKEYALLMPLLIPLALHVFTKNNIRFLTVGLQIVLFIISGFVIIYFNASKSLGVFQAMIFIISVPAVFAAIVFVFLKKSLREKNELLLMTGLLTTCLFYLGIRISAVGLTPGVPDTELLNNPYLLATGEQEWATKIFVMLKYLGLTVFPHPLISDYSFESIVYRNFMSWDFILSAILNLSLVIAGIIYTIKRHVLGFSILAYYIFLIPVCNFFFSSSIVMLETYLFHPSFAFSLAFAWIILQGFDRLGQFDFTKRRTALLTCLTVMVLVFGYKTVERCKDWKNDVTLFFEDVNTAPNSVLVLGNAGARWIDLADTKEITGIALPDEDPAMVNDYNGHLKIADEELAASGFSDKREVVLNKGINYLKHAVELHPRYVNGYLNLGLAYFKLNKEYETIYYWKMAELLYPDNPYLRNYYIVYNNILNNRGAEAIGINDYKTALQEFNKCVILDPFNSKSWFNLGGAYYKLDNYEKAKDCWKKSLSLHPANEEEIKKLLFPMEANDNSK
ncbi:MAG: tetratricopeptide repeat protein [Bacteroidetes bacterium]|nr:tetratricopeptide repeat protein [Bacteroidota bacterium]